MIAINCSLAASLILRSQVDALINGRGDFALVEIVRLSQGKESFGPLVSLTKSDASELAGMPWFIFDNMRIVLVPGFHLYGEKMNLIAKNINVIDSSSSLTIDTQKEILWFSEWEDAAVANKGRSQ